MTITKEDIIRKLSSRKFWVCLVAFVSALLTAYNVPEASISQVVSIIMAFGALIAYIFAEGSIDKARAAKTDEDEVKDWTDLEYNKEVK